MIPLLICSACHAFSPQYPERGNENLETALQARFHEKVWKDCSDEEFRQVSRELHSVVNHYESCGALDNLRKGDMRVLELGCGRGCLLRALLDQGWNAQGSEPSSDLTQRAARIFGFENGRLFTETIRETVARLSGIGEKVDVIFLWHVLEHLLQPIDALKNLKRILAQNGVVIAQVPLLDTRYIYPEHLFLASPATPNVLAQTAGFALSNFTVDASYNFLSFSLVNSTTASANTRPPSSTA
jgi:2-polyprenyl-3-methyl-5-hydroxy-6-metoxy-1,4-benzoquinol methylase